MLLEVHRSGLRLLRQLQLTPHAALTAAAARRRRGASPGPHEQPLPRAPQPKQVADVAVPRARVCSASKWWTTSATPAATS